MAAEGLFLRRAAGGLPEEGAGGVGADGADANGRAPDDQGEQSGAVPPPKLPKPEPGPRLGVKGECRICFDVCDVSELIEPCGCQGNSRFVHYNCCQTWISQDRFIGSKATFCEVCKCEWKYDFHIPEPNTPPPAEQMERLSRILSVSWFRIAMGTAGDREYRFVLSAGRQVQGPWSDWLAARDRKERSLLHRMSRWWDTTRMSMVRGANASLEGAEADGSGGAAPPGGREAEGEALTESSEQGEVGGGGSNWLCCSPPRS